MFNYNLVIRMLGNIYLGLVGLAQLAAAGLSWVAIAEVDRLSEVEDGVLAATYAVLGCFRSDLAVYVAVAILTLGGLGLIIAAVLRLRANLTEPRRPAPTAPVMPISTEGLV
jgi:hypothetical protein